MSVQSVRDPRGHRRRFRFRNVLAVADDRGTYRDERPERVRNRDTGSKNAGIGTSIAARILRERSVSELEFVDLTYSKVPPLAIPECTRKEYMEYKVIL